MFTWLRNLFEAEPSVYPLRADLTPYPLRIRGEDLGMLVKDCITDRSWKCRRVAAERWYILKELPIPNESSLPCYTVLDKLAIRRYACMGTPFPPIIFGRWGELIDGLHRLHAARARGDAKIWAYAPEGTKREPRL